MLTDNGGPSQLEHFLQENGKLRAENEQLRTETHFKACLVRDLLPYQERAIKAEADLACVTQERDEARAICYAWERRCDALAAKLARCEGLLREARERETRYVLPLYRDDNYTASIDAYFAASEQEPCT